MFLPSRPLSDISYFRFMWTCFPLRLRNLRKKPKSVYGTNDCITPIRQYMYRSVKHMTRVLFIHIIFWLQRYFDGFI